jgi:putative DNA primase/helicase
MSADCTGGLAMLAALGLAEPKDGWVADGGLHRCPLAAKGRGKDGAYIIHADERPSAYGRNWVTGEERTWTAQRPETMTDADRAAHGARMAAARKAAEEGRRRQHARAAVQARKMLDRAAPCTAHPYLEAKGVAPCEGLRVSGDALLVPVQGEDGMTMSLQRIVPDGKGGFVKRFFQRGRTSGGHYLIPPKDSVARKAVLVCEGLATGLSLGECTGHAVLVAFSAGNLKAVAEAARATSPRRQIAICADDDGDATDNPGIRHAAAAAEAVNGVLVRPGSGNGQACDFNDMHNKEGKMAVADRIHVALKEQWDEAWKAEPAGVTSRPGLVAMDANDLVKLELPERRFLVDPVLPQQGLAMLHAFRGVGKTYCALAIALAAASGGKAFGRWTCPAPVRVLYMDGEMPLGSMQARLREMAAAVSETRAPGFLRIINPDMQRDVGGVMPNLATHEGQAALEPLLDGMELIVVDNLATLHRGSKDNDVEGWHVMQEWLLRQRTLGRSVLLVHHQGKGGDQRVSSAKEDILDTVMSLKRPTNWKEEDGAVFEVRLTKARAIHGKAAAPFEARLVPGEDGGLGWAVRDVESALLEQVAAIVATGETRKRVVAEELGIKETTAWKLIQEVKRRNAETARAE